MGSAVILLSFNWTILGLVVFMPACFIAKGPMSIGGSDDSRKIILDGNVLPLQNMEEEQKFDDNLVWLLAKIIEDLPSLEI